MTISHAALTGSEVHEPKGIGSAGAGTAYIANGSGSGTWSNPTSGINNKNLMILSASFADISTAGSIFVATPIAGKITRINVTLNNAITSADSAVSAKINGVTVTGSAITVAQSGSTAGSTFHSTPSAANVLAQDGVVEIVTDGASSTTCVANVTILLDVS